MGCIRISFWARISLLFLIRSSRTTVALSVMVVSAVSTLVFLSALSIGVEDAMLRNTVGLFSGHITGYNLGVEVPAQELDIDGVDAVLKRSVSPGVLSYNALSRKIMVYGVDPEMEKKQTALFQKLTEGRYLRPERREILISRNIAKTMGISINDTLQLALSPGNTAIRFSVSGIFQTGIAALDHNTIFIPLTPTTIADTPWIAAIFLKTGVEPDPVIEFYRQKYPPPANFESWEAQMPDLKQLIDLETISMVIIMILVFGVVAIGIACSFVIFIIRNMREYGILKAMGVTSSELSILIVAKVIFMNIFACTIGLLFGIISVLLVEYTGGIDISRFTSHNQYFAVSGIIMPRLTMFSLWSPPAIALIFALIASLWPAALVSRKKVADILRMV